MVKGTAELERPVPLYMQVVRQLRAQIASGELADGDRIPSQREMMARWHISMQTASKVIGALKTEGLAIPSVGRDTIVAPGAAARIAAACAGTAHAAAEPPPAPGPASPPQQPKPRPPPTSPKSSASHPAAAPCTATKPAPTTAARPISVTTTWFPPAIADKAPRLADSQPLPGGTSPTSPRLPGTARPAYSKNTPPCRPMPTLPARSACRLARQSSSLAHGGTPKTEHYSRIRRAPPSPPAGTPGPTRSQPDSAVL